MAEKNIFVYNFFLSLTISDFSLFLLKNWSAASLKKFTPSKFEVLLGPLLFENFLGQSTVPPAEEGEGVVHPM